MVSIASHDLANTVVVALERMAFVLTEEIDATEAAELFPPHLPLENPVLGAGRTGSHHDLRQRGLHHGDEFEHARTRT
jgi:hypothetical protein